MRDLQFASNEEIAEKVREKAIIKRIKKKIDKVIKNDCKGCWYSVEIQKLLHKI